MNITITIDREKVYSDVAQESVYIGGRSVQTDGSNIDKVFVTDDDKIYLDKMFRDACSTLGLSLTEYVSAATPLSPNPNKQDNYEIVLTLPDNVSEITLSSLPSDVHNYVVTSVLADYLLRIGVEDYQTYIEQGKALIESIINELSERKRPKYAEVVAERSGL